MWADATDFTYDDERFAAAFAELEDAAYSGSRCPSSSPPWRGS